MISKNVENIINTMHSTRITGNIHKITVYLGTAVIHNRIAQLLTVIVFQTLFTIINWWLFMSGTRVSKSKTGVIEELFTFYNS